MDGDESGEKEEKQRMTPVQWEALKLNTSLVNCGTLQIGNWEIHNFLAKFLYDAKLFVWEFTEGNAKMRFEIPWSSVASMEFFRPRMTYKSALILELNSPPQIFEGDKETQSSSGGTKWIRKSSRGLIVEQFRVHRLFFEMSLDIHVEVLKRVDARVKRMLAKGVTDIIKDTGFGSASLPPQTKPVYVAKDQHHIKTIRALVDIHIASGEVKPAIMLLNHYVHMHVDFRQAGMHLNFPVHQALGVCFEDVPYVLGKEFARLFHHKLELSLPDLKEQKQRLWSWSLAMTPDREGPGPFDEAIALLDDKILKHLSKQKDEDGNRDNAHSLYTNKSDSTMSGIRNFKPYHNLITRTKLHQWTEVVRLYLKKEQPLKAINSLKTISNVQVDRTILKRKEGERELRDNLNFLYDLGDLWNRVVRMDFRMTEGDIVELQRILKRHANDLEKYGLAEPYDACPFSDAMAYLATRQKQEARTPNPSSRPVFANSMLLYQQKQNSQSSSRNPNAGSGGAGGGVGSSSAGATGGTSHVVAAAAGGGGGATAGGDSSNAAAAGAGSPGAAGAGSPAPPLDGAVGNANA